MIYVTGDTHGNVRRFNTKNFPEQKEMTKNDYVIIVGDFGVIWDGSKEDQFWLKWLDKKPFTTLWIDGNHCVSSETEILTSNGWINVVDAYKDKDLKIANFNINTQEIFFDKPLKRIKSYKENAIEIEGKNTHQIVSEDHDVIVNGKKIKAHELIGKKIQENQFFLKGNTNSNQKGIDLTDDEIRLLTWVIMDGTMVDNSKYQPNSKKIRIQFKLSREDKIEKIQILLNKMQIPFTIKPATMSKTNVKQPYYIRIYSTYARDIFEKLQGTKSIPENWRDLNKNQLKIFLSTLADTDGHYKDESRNQIEWRSTNKKDVDIIQETCIKNNYYCKYTLLPNGSGFKENCKMQYKTNIYNNKQTTQMLKINKKSYNDHMYCFTMHHGTLITRIGGKVAFTGNCNFDLINQYPVEEWNGGKIHRINNSVFHLMRGQVFTIDGLKFFTMGGASSIDIEHRKEGISWWPEEIPSHAEFEEGLKNLGKHNWIVDVVLTHTCPTKTLMHMSERFTFDLKPTDAVNGYLDQVEEKIGYKHWFFGHFHQNVYVGNNQTMLYNSIINLEECLKENG